MNLNGTIIVVVVVLAILGSFFLFKKYGAKWEFIVAPIAIFIVAFLMLYVFNRGMPSLVTQASGVTNQIQDLANLAAPDWVSPSSGTSGPNVGVSGNGGMNGSNTYIGGSSSTGTDGTNGETTYANPPVPTPVPVMPVAGDTKYVGNVYPAFNDPALYYQAQCYSAQYIYNLASTGRFPQGMTINMTTKQWTFFLPATSEEWTVMITFPSNQVPNLTFTVDGTVARSMKNALGSWYFATGAGPWATVQQVFDGVGWVYSNPLICRFP